MEILILVVVTYLLLSIGATGAYLADTRHHSKGIEEYFSYRSDLAASIFFGFIPIIGWVICIFVTGFFEHGWTLRDPNKVKKGF